MLDHLSQRTLGGVTVLDHVTGRPTSRQVEFRSDSLEFARTNSGIFQIKSAPDFEGYVKAFQSPAPIQISDFSYEIHDNTRHFLPVASTISLPRNVSPDAVSDRVDTPIEVELPSAPSRPIAVGYTLCRVSVADQNGVPIQGVLVQALKPGTTDEIAWGVSAQNGEALIPILGIALLKTVDPGPDPDPGADEELTSSQTPIRLSLTVDATQPWPANPQTLRAGGGSLKTMTDTTNLTLTAGGNVHRALTLDLS
ncbi:MAG: hypothetical protein ABJL99_03465 [Aliishimia sp.]